MMSQVTPTPAPPVAAVDLLGDGGLDGLLGGGGTSMDTLGGLSDIFGSAAQASSYIPPQEVCYNIKIFICFIYNIYIWLSLFWQPLFCFYKILFSLLCLNS